MRWVEKLNMVCVNHQHGEFGLTLESTWDAQFRWFLSSFPIKVCFLSLPVLCYFYCSLVLDPNLYFSFRLSSPYSALQACLILSNPSRFVFSYNSTLSCCSNYEIYPTVIFRWWSFAVCVARPFQDHTVLFYFYFFSPESNGKKRDSIKTRQNKHAWGWWTKLGRSW